MSYNFKIGDAVLVVISDGDLTGQYGKIIAIKHSKAKVKLVNSIHWIRLSHLKKA